MNRVTERIRFAHHNIAASQLHTYSSPTTDATPAILSLRASRNVTPTSEITFQIDRDSTRSLLPDLLPARIATLHVNIFQDQVFQIV